MLNQQTRSAPTVLVADDEELVCATIENVLEHAGYRVRTVIDGDAAVESALTEKPDLILCDVRLPKKNGFEVIQEIARKSDRDIPFFLFSGLELEDLRKASEKVGAEAFIAKPVDAAALVRRVAEKIGRVRSDAECKPKDRYIDLQPAIDILGHEWARLRSRAFAIAEQMVFRDLRRGETYVSDNLRGIYLLSPGSDPAKAELRIERLRREILRRLIGERSGSQAGTI